MHVGLICNPDAGGGRSAKVVREAEDCLRRHAVDVIVRETEAPRQAERIARELAESVDVVVAVGGDGTVNEVINGLTDTGVPLGIIPGGTVNVLSLELGIPSDVETACAVIVDGQKTALDLGKAGGRRFILMMGAGIDALAIRELDARTKRRFKEAAFISSGLRAYARNPMPDFEVQVDGRATVGNFAVVANCRYYGGRFGVAKWADPTDGLFDVLVYEGRGFFRDALFWASMPLEWHIHHPGVTYLQGARVDFRLVVDDAIVWYQTDGELAGRLPVSVQIEQGALQVLAARNDRVDQE